MLNTKDVAGYLRPLAPQVATPARRLDPRREEHPARRGHPRRRPRGRASTPTTADTVGAALAAIAAADPAARVLICGSLYLAGQVLRENG